MAAGRPDIVILQHAPNRMEYDGFPGYPIQPLTQQAQAVSLLSGKPVAAITVNHENTAPENIHTECESIRKYVGIPAFDVLKDGGKDLAEMLISSCLHGKDRHGKR